MGRRCKGRDCIIAQQTGVIGLGRRGPGDHGEINFEAVELTKEPGRIAGEEAHRDLRITLAKAPDEGQDMGRRIGTNAEAPLLHPSLLPALPRRG